jgi:hypothetical protein
MPVALKHKQRDGTPYRRPPNIEVWIEKLESVDVSVRLPQFGRTSRKHPEYVPTEVVLHFLRQAWINEEKGQFDKIFPILLSRVEQSLRSTIRNSHIGNATDIRDEIVSRFVVLVTKDCTSQSTRLDFFEIHFDQAMVALRTSVLRKFKTIAGDITIVPLGTQESDGPEISSEVEVALEAFLSGDPQKIDDPAFRSMLFAAINRLPQDQKQVIGLLLQGIPIDAKEKDVMTIARILKCDERTVRNRRDRACKALKADLVKEAEL